MTIKLVLVCFSLISMDLFCQNDTVIFSSEKVGLIILTQNIDSIKYFPEKQNPNPFGPTMETYATRINSWDTAELSVTIKDNNQNILVVYIWHKILPGAYKFYWWENMQYIPAGIYYIETNINNKITTNKAVIVK